MARQLTFSTFHKLKEKDFGGSLLRGNAREQRPISVKRPMHLVMRSSLATGTHSFRRTQNARRIEMAFRSMASKHSVKIYRYANSGNHLHLILLPKSRVAFRNFIRAITGLIARIVLKAERGKARTEADEHVEKSTSRFWDARPFSRILEWGRDYQNVCWYLLQNTLEATGFMPYRPRSRGCVEGVP